MSNISQPEAAFPDEASRLADLAQYQILDTDPEEGFDRLARLAAQLIGTPIALVSFVDEDRQWFKARVGLSATETPREHAFCSHAIENDAVFEITDASIDDRFSDNPLVTGDPHIRFYAGAPLITPQGSRLGTLCVIDRQPRSLSVEERTLLTELSFLAATELELRRALSAEIQARAAIEAQDQAKSLFMSRMTHEIRSPLASILGASDYMVRKQDGEQDPYLTIIHQSAHDLLDTCNEVLDHAAIEREGLFIRPEWLRLDQKMSKVVRRLQPLAEEKGLELEIVAPPVDTPENEIFCDPLRFRQILFQLVRNAIKFTEKGRVTIALSVERTDIDTPDALLSLTVEDTGIGMDAATLERAFEPFAQADEGLTRAHGGTGIGLALVKRLVELMGGRTTARSETNNGTQIRVMLPVQILIDRNSQIDGAEEGGNPPEEEFDVSAFRVLLVEDNGTLRKVVTSVLEEIGFEVDVATDGEAGVRAVVAAPPDAVLMDLHMPGITGYEAAGRIRQELGDAAPLIIAMSADEEHLAMSRPGSEMLDGYIPKPIDWPTFLEKLAFYLGGENEEPEVKARAAS